MVWNWVVFMVGPSSAALWNSVTNVLRASSKSEYWDSSRTQTVILISDQWSITRNKTALMALFKDHIINLPAEHSHYWLLWNLLETSNFLRREIHHWLITCIYDLHQCVNRRTNATVCFLLPETQNSQKPDRKAAKRETEETSHSAASHRNHQQIRAVSAGLSLTTSPRMLFNNDVFYCLMITTDA